MDEPGFSFQTGPGRIVLGAFVPADGAGVPDDRVPEETAAAPEAVPFRFLPSPFDTDITVFDQVNEWPNWPKADRGYVDPEQIASWERQWPDEAA